MGQSQIETVAEIATHDYELCSQFNNSACKRRRHSHEENRDSNEMDTSSIRHPAS